MTTTDLEKRIVLIIRIVQSFPAPSSRNTYLVKTKTRLFRRGMACLYSRTQAGPRRDLWRRHAMQAEMFASNLVNNIVKTSNPTESLVSLHEALSL